MIYWDFKEEIFYQGDIITQDSRKFEILVETYLKYRYPLENWKLTKATRDGNRDIENTCEFSGLSMWAEVKYTIHTNKNLSSRKYDSTLVSSLFEKNLIKIFFVTNTTIGSNLIGRVKKFYYLSPVDQIAFVDGYTLAYWIKKHPTVEKTFFKNPINFTLPQSPSVQLQCIRMLCKNDSFTMDSILEGQTIYPLYLSNNYILEGEFIAVGFDNIPLFLYCNEKLLYHETVPPEIVTFSFDINGIAELFDINKEYPLHLYYILDNKKHSCGNYNLRFAVMGKLYQNQVQSYLSVDNGINATYKKIYNIYGPKNSGKSWLLNNLKNDMLKKSRKNQRIIYVNFSGQDADVADICRIIFTLLLDYYNLDISADSLLDYCRENSVKNSFLNYKNIHKIIQYLQDNNYSMVQNILKASIFIHTETLFEIKQCFDIERVYFIDNIHLLNTDNYNILYTILKFFNPMKGVSFVLTGREKINGSNIENVCLDYINSEEVLSEINEVLSFSIESLEEILPKKHFLIYPGLLHSFLQDIKDYSSTNALKHYYIDTFQNSALQYTKGDFIFDSIVLLLICFVKKGIPCQLLQGIDTAQLSQLFNKQLIINKGGDIYPNFEKWNGDIPFDIINVHKKELVDYILQFMEQDYIRKEIYQCALIVYYPEYYNYYFNSVFENIKIRFIENRYSHVIYLCETLMKHRNFYSGETENLDYVRYFLAFSYMHCDASKNAKKIFQEIAENYQMRAKTALYFDAESEIIDAEYWEFQNFAKLPKHINCFRKNWKIVSQEIPNLQIRAYLTATNRMMVTYLALDFIHLAEKWFRKNIKLAIEFNANEHLGYTYMDYAKGIYHIDLMLALKYLQIADSYFHVSSEQRRHFDCLCEIEYVKLLLGMGSIQQLLSAQEALFEKQYWIQYYKCDLKIAVCYILQGNIPFAKKYLLEAEAPAMMKNNERVKYLSSMINSFLYKEPISYKNETLAGTSYQNIIDAIQLNYKQSKVELYLLGKSDNIFYLDPRVW